MMSLELAIFCCAVLTCARRLKSYSVLSSSSFWSACSGLTFRDLNTPSTTFSNGLFASTFLAYGSIEQLTIEWRARDAPSTQSKPFSLTSDSSKSNSWDRRPPISSLMLLRSWGSTHRLPMKLRVVLLSKTRVPSSDKILSALLSSVSMAEARSRGFCTEARMLERVPMKSAGDSEEMSSLRNFPVP